MVVIKRFADETQLEYDWGKFDAWCVYLRHAPPQQQRIAPRDADYFRDLQNLSKQHGAKKIYQDFVRLYNATSAELEDRIILGISRLSELHYGKDALQMDKLFSILYAGMVAEENKQHAKLKKRIKRLGVHQVLIENHPPEFAANFSRNKPWRELDRICEARGF